MNREVLNSLSDLMMLESDYELIRQGYKFNFVLNYSELYRYAFPLLDYLKTRNRDNYFAMQIALRYAIDIRAVNWVIPRATFDLLQSEIRDAPQKWSAQVYHTEFNWKLYDSAVEQAYVQSGGSERLLRFLSEQGLHVNATDLMRPLLDAIKLRLIEAELKSGLETIEKLISSRKVRPMTLEEEQQPKEHPSFEPIVQRLFELRTHETGGIPKFSTAADSRVMAAVALLNRGAVSSREIYVIVGDFSRGILDERGLDVVTELISPSGKATKLPIARSLWYCLFDAVFTECGTEASYDIILQRMRNLRHFLDIDLVELDQRHKEFLSGKPSAEFRVKYEKIEFQLEDVKRRAQQLPFSKTFRKALEFRIRDELGISGEGVTALSERLKSQLDRILGNPERLFGWTSEYERKLNELRLQVEKLKLLINE